MNTQLTQVLTNSTGLTGLTIIRAIVAGARDPLRLAQLGNPNGTSSEEQVAKALTGTWRDEHLFALHQSLALFDYYTALVAACDAQIEQQFAVMKPRWEPIARVVYHLLKNHEVFEETSATEYDQQCRERELKYLQRKYDAAIDRRAYQRPSRLLPFVLSLPHTIAPHLAVLQYR